MILYQSFQRLPDIFLFRPVCVNGNPEAAVLQQIVSFLKLLLRSIWRLPEIIGWFSYIYHLHSTSCGADGLALFV